LWNGAHIMKNHMTERFPPVNTVPTLVTLAGWVDALRDHGEVLFIHLRDRSGIVQVVFTPEAAPQAVCTRRRRSGANFAFVSPAGSSSGRRAPRTRASPPAASRWWPMRWTILGVSAALPFPISEKSMVAGAAVKRDETVGEDLRLQYRYLDIRRPSMQDHLIKRHRIVKTIRDFLDTEGFIEIETPMLTKSTPEGPGTTWSRAGISPKISTPCPSRPSFSNSCSWWAAWSAISRSRAASGTRICGPTGSRNSPSWTSKPPSSTRSTFTPFSRNSPPACSVGGIDLPRPFPRMTWTDAMNTAGSDRPDLRFGMTFKDATDLFTGPATASSNRSSNGAGASRASTSRASPTG
jgi:aspartyl-tRNA synthetase